MILGCEESFKLGRDYDQQDTAADRSGGFCPLTITDGKAREILNMVNINNIETITIFITALYMI